MCNFSSEKFILKVSKLWYYIIIHCINEAAAISYMYFELRLTKVKFIFKYCIQQNYIQNLLLVGMMIHTTTNHKQIHCTAHKNITHRQHIYRYLYSKTLSWEAINKCVTLTIELFWEDLPIGKEEVWISVQINGWLL